MKSQRKKTPLRVAALDTLKPIHPHAAGIDIGSSQLYVAVPADRATHPVRVFKSFTRSLHEIADWLKQCGVTTVAMESTGIYWIPLYEILEAQGFEVKLVNARQVKNLPGRKSDILDCQWIQQLHSYGLLAGSFRPEGDIVALRSLIRHRENLIQARAAHIQHMQKALHLMNLQLDNVISDITGVTGMRILRAIVAGERDLEVLASYRDPNCKNPPSVIYQSLEGHYKSEHLFQLEQSLALYDYYTQLMAACDGEIEKQYAQLPAQVPEPVKPLAPLPKNRRRPRKNDPPFDLRTQLYRMGGVDLTAIDGCNAATIQTVLSETGVEMSFWKTSRHFTSWLGLCPRNEVSGGKVLKSKTLKTKSRANTALRLAAQALHHSDSWLGAYYRRQRARLGAAKANMATAHKLARLIYFMLKHQKEFVDFGAQYYQAHYRERQIKGLHQKAASLGFKLVPVAA
jgi:transposase